MIHEQILKELSKRLTLIERNHGYFSFLAERRFTNEKLLQLETIKTVSDLSNVVDYLPEKNYPKHRKEKVDIWFKTKDEVEHWMEVKMRGTNYHRKKKSQGKAITHGVESIIRDIKRLKEYSPSNSARYVLFSFLPLYPDSYSIFNERHLLRISQEIGQRFTKPSISIQLKEGTFDLYLTQL